MEVAICSVQPNPIAVRTGDLAMLAITVVATTPHPKARIRLRNMQPRAAELIDSDEFGHAVHTSARDLEVGNTNFDHELRFRLDGATVISGAVIGLGLEVISEQGDVISPQHMMLAIIGA